MRVRMAGLVGVALLVAAVGVALLVLVGASDDGPTIAELEVGDCFELPEDATDVDRLRSVEVVDCATPHEAEVVSDGTLDTDAPYPDDDELFGMVERACRDAGVVGSDAFGLLPVAPPPERWEAGDGRYLCVAIPFGGEPVTGSIVTG